MSQEPSEDLSRAPTSLEVLMTSMIPASRYIESRLDSLDEKVGGLRDDLKFLRNDMDKRFDLMREDFNYRFTQVDRKIDGHKEEMDRRFAGVEQKIDGHKEEMDRRFTEQNAEMNRRFTEQNAEMDRRFTEQNAEMNRRFAEQKADMDRRFDHVVAAIEALSGKLDQRDERQRRFTLQMFSLSITISLLGVTGVFLKTLGVF